MAKMPKFCELHCVHFITIKTYNNIPYFRIKENCFILLKVINRVRAKLKFKLKGYCIMPNHVHLLIEPYLGANEFAPTRKVGIIDNNQVGRTNPQLGRSDFNRTNISYIVKRIKGYSARLINKHLQRRGTFWKKDFYDFNVYSDKKFDEKLNYLHNNPLRAGLAKDLKDYPWSSYQNYYFNNKSLISINY